MVHRRVRACVDWELCLPVARSGGDRDKSKDGSCVGRSAREGVPEDARLAEEGLDLAEREDVA
jgi:hypothetical protein